MHSVWNKKKNQPPSYLNTLHWLINTKYFWCCCFCKWIIFENLGPIILKKKRLLFNLSAQVTSTTLICNITDSIISLVWLHRQMLTDIWFICIYSAPLPGWLNACAGLWVSLIGSGSKNDLLCKWQLKRLKQWVNVWCVCKHVCVCWSWNCFCWGRRKNFQGLIRELPEQDQSVPTAELSMWR